MSLGRNLRAGLVSRWHFAAGAGRALSKEGLHIVDRVAIKRESKQTSPPSLMPPSADWFERLHEMLGVPNPCPACAAFDDVVWKKLIGRIATSTPSAGPRHDADKNLALVAWAATTHLKPISVVETGVARGITSAVILQAMESNGRGALYSIDLPPLTHGWAEQSGSAVPRESRDRWHYVRGSARRMLPEVLARLGNIDVFLHDSLHTYNHMLFEYGHAWSALGSGGLLISDDVGDSRAFEDFVLRTVDSREVRWVVGAGAAKQGNTIGIVLKV